ncbi:MAG TPA: hypothetical protein VIV59_04115 [Anaeromyxobacteraceae bacterium]
MSDLQSVLQFLEEQKAKQAAHFHAVKQEKILSFMGTTGQPGQHAAVAAVPLGAIEPGPTPSELRVMLRGTLPRQLTRGECITVHVTRVEQYQGYQVKTGPLAATGSEEELYEQKAGELWVKGQQIFTVHHSPYTMKFFEQIPFDEVKQTVGAVKVALVGVGENANISPRFIFHYESKMDRLVLYHGDGLALKTYMNLKANRQETRLVLDLDTYEGYAFRGTVEEFAPHQNPLAYDKICGGFNSGNWGKPSRVFRLVADQWTRLEAPKT